MTMVFSFIYKYFFDALVIAAFSIFSKAIYKQFGNDRANTIKETILSAMLWAEETFGIGQGDQKWSAAWKKIVELLKVQGIVLKDKEVTLVRDLMKANVPEINALTYSAMPQEIIDSRAIKRDLSTTELVAKLKKKYPVAKE